MKRKQKITINLIIVAAAFVYFFVNTPMLNPMYSEGAFFWISLVSVFVAANQLMKVKGLEFKAVNGSVVVDYDKSSKLKLNKKLIGVIVALWIIYFVVHIISSPIFFYRTYRDQMAEPVSIEFTEDVQAVDLNQIPIVDKSLAALLADKELGEKPSLGSQVVLGEPTIQTVDGELVWIVPLQHSGFFRWIDNMDGAAGYIKVSATNLQDVEYVDEFKVKIQPNSYFFDDLQRLLRFGDAAFTGITDYTFELDDTGYPYWVVTTYENLRGFALPEATGVIVVDAQTGDMQKYDLDNIPDWVDRVQPEDFIIEQLNNKGEYVHGIFNFSNKDKYMTSSDGIIVYNEGRCYLFTGLTSVGADNSALGFVMVDMVTKEPVIYNMSGATEIAAVGSAEGKVQDLGYQGTMPLIINVEEYPTYFLTLKDNAGLIKNYAFVSVEDYATVGVGDTVSEARDDYLDTMKEMGIGNDFTEDESKVAVSKGGIIERISWNVVDGTTMYYLIFEGNDEKIYAIDSEVSPEIALTQIGDSISIKYYENEIINEVLEFDNQNIG